MESLFPYENVAEILEESQRSKQTTFLIQGSSAETRPGDTCGEDMLRIQKA